MADCNWIEARWLSAIGRGTCFFLLVLGEARVEQSKQMMLEGFYGRQGLLGRFFPSRM